MKKIGVFIIICFLLVGVVSAKLTSLAVDNNANVGNPENNNSNIEQTQENNSRIDSEIQNRIKNRLTDEQIQRIIQAKNRIHAMIESGECPGNCTCDGSVVKCQLRNGTREITINAGKSGNMVVQVQGVNASTKVELYKSEDGKIYGVFGNETKEVKLLPDQVKEKIRERLARDIEAEEIELNENGTYNYRAQERARLLFFFPVRLEINAELNPETGEVIKLRKPWWSFLAKEEGEEIVGAGCGTVTPGYNDKCCQNKGYDSYNTETGECIFEEN